MPYSRCGVEQQSLRALPEGGDGFSEEEGWPKEGCKEEVTSHV
jgi:hypothetical protein